MLNNYILKNLTPNSVNYIDIGARGGIKDSLPPILWECVSIIGFEPDMKATNFLDQQPNSKCYTCGLSNKNEVVDFYLNHNGPTSSLYPANYPYIEQYNKKNNTGRITKKVVKVDCKRLDNVLTEIPHLIKIDTQGSEFDILQGSENLLKKYAPVVITETWTKEVYRGARPAWSIMDYMDSLGYDLFDLNVAAAWGHETNGKIKNYKQKNVGLDFLFVKRIDALKKTDLVDVDWVILCSLLECYGFRDYAWYISDLIDFVSSKIIKEKLEYNDKLDFKISRKILRRICKIFKINNLIHKPRLHY